jgi:riboflavin synthase
MCERTVFTGIVEVIGAIESVRRGVAGTTFAVRADAERFASGLKPGDSVAVNGVCLTVERSGPERFEATAVGETLARTTLGRARAGDRVNLERAATPNTALGGHIVQGHVDGVGRVQSFAKNGLDRLLTVKLPADVYDYVVPKGAIAIDGVSLTVIERQSTLRITITMVPFTLERTIAAFYRSGTEVNVEVDVIGKYVRDYLTRMQ